VLRRIFGPKRDEETGNEFNELYYSPNIVRLIKSRRMRWARHVEGVGEMRALYSVVVGKTEGKRQLGRPRHRCEDIIKMGSQEWDGKM
jgi:hypothetical protein